jgi:flagellar M-ring protein FliF
VGFDPSRGDVLTVEDIAFEGNHGAAPVSVPQKVLDEAESFPLLLKYAALLLGIIAVTAFGIRPALRQLATTSPDPVKQNSLPSGTQVSAALPMQEAEHDPERVRSQEIFEQVTQQLKREPTQGSRLLQSWIHSE